MWWNIRTSFSENGFVTASAQDPKKPTLVRVRQSKDLVVLRPIHQIHLSESGQFYGLIIGPATLVLVQNDCILSFYNVDYSKSKVVVVAKEALDQLEIDIQTEHQKEIEQKEETSKQVNAVDLN